VNKPRCAPWIHEIPAYVPGTSKDSIARRYGIKDPIKLASNENPLGPSPMAVAAMESALTSMHLYPDPDATELREAAASFFGCDPRQVIAGNGSDEILDLLCRAFLTPGAEVIVPGLTFSYYRIASLVCGARVVPSAMKGFSIDVDDILRKTSGNTAIVFLANPNNPTGTCLSRSEVERLVSGIPAETLLVLDEAYASFVRQEDFLSGVGLVGSRENLATVHTLSKSHGLAGLRVGLCVAGEHVISSLARIKPPFNMNSLAIRAGAAALKDDAFLRKTLELTWQGLDYLCSEAKALDIECVPSQTNFVLMRIGKDCLRVYEDLLRRGIITRAMTSFGLADYLRVSVGLPQENEAFIAALKEVL
jgi:histidinol-phosphate aminotransferase